MGFRNWRAAPERCAGISRRSSQCSPSPTTATSLKAQLPSGTSRRRDPAELSGPLPDGQVLSVLEKRWRKRRDSNPRYPFRYASFQDWSHQPLGHSSSPDSIMRMHLAQKVLPSLALEPLSAVNCSLSQAFMVFIHVTSLFSDAWHGSGGRGEVNLPLGALLDSSCGGGH